MRVKGHRLVALRKSKILTQEQLAGRSRKVDPTGIGISSSYISKLERGGIPIGFKAIQILCAILECTPNDIAEWTAAELESFEGAHSDHVHK